MFILVINYKKPSVDCMRGKAIECRPTGMHFINVFDRTAELRVVCYCMRWRKGAGFGPNFGVTATRSQSDQGVLDFSRKKKPETV